MVFCPLDSSKLAAKRAKNAAAAAAAAAAAKEKDAKKALVKKEAEDRSGKGKEDGRHRRPSSTDKQAVSTVTAPGPSPGFPNTVRMFMISLF